MLLLGLAFLHAKSRNVAVLSLISWLLVGNIIQGVNSIMWAGNVTVRHKVWCDISSKLLFGSRIALPATCTCICIHLHYLSSSRNTRLRRFRVLTEFTGSLILPVIYMALHMIVQDRRFLLLEDFGCISSVHTSSPALILVWLPPLIFSAVSIIYASLAMWRHTRRNKLILDRAGVSSRLVTVSFLRPLITAVFTSLFILVASVFDIYAAITLAHGIPQWTSLALVHSTLSEVLVIPSSNKLQFARAEVFWWLIPASTLVFSLMAAIGLLLCSEDGSIAGFRSVRKWFRSTMLRQTEDKDTFIQSYKDMSRRLTLAPPTPPLPVHLSGTGWDDTLRGSASSKPKLHLLCDVPLRQSSPTDSESEYDTTFKASTLAYLKSPTGRETILHRPQTSSPTPGPISQVCPRWSTLLATPPPALAPLPPVPPAHSILSSPWPQPPSTVPVSPISPQRPESTSTAGDLSEHGPVLLSNVDHHHLREPSLSSFTGSLASITDTGSYAPNPDIFLHSVRSPVGPAPFQHAGIPMAAVDKQTSSLPRSPRRVSSKESLSSRSASLSIKRNTGPRRKESYGDAVYMTVVHETQAV
ncbi:pheromone A receptor-domain-containing protein [Irpex rosettiformis]|uniref:Pheromone A receptor-domain-containing protein n=1 Tax=Irpex rosettiformis TaxID=378272 RepID=A0ACB8U0G3_9APHY|nr:pheromone A receptor-domain-containing protein [Irpex rosettiformis]